MVSPLYNVLWECIVVVYKHFDWSLHVMSSSNGVSTLPKFDVHI